METDTQQKSDINRYTCPKCRYKMQVYVTRANTIICPNCGHNPVTDKKQITTRGEQ